MALDKAQRYQSVADLQRDIAAYQTGFATSAENAGLMKQIILLIKRNKGVFATVFAAWAIITVLAVWFIISIRASERKATRNAEIAEQNAQLAAASERRAIEEKEATRQALAKAQLALAEGAFREEDGVVMQAALNAVPEDLRDSNWSYLLARADTSLATIRTGLGSGLAESWSVAAHPKQPGVFALALRNGTIAFVKPTGEILKKFDVGFSQKAAANFILAFSPDGERIAIGRRDINETDQISSAGIVIQNTSDGSKLLEIAAPPALLLEFDNEGQRLLQTTNDHKQVKVWDTTSGKLLWETKPAANHRAAFDPKGKFVVAYSDTEKLRILDAKDGSLIRTLPAATDASSFVVIQPNDGNRLLTGDTKGSVRQWDIRDGKTLFEIRASKDHSINSVAFTPDGERFVTLANEPGGKQSLQVWRLSGGKHLQTLMGGSGEAFGLAVHPLSGEIVVAGRVTKSWSLTNAPVKWMSVRGFCQDACFWGEDDLLFGPAIASQSGLFDLSAADKSTSPVWKSKNGFPANTVSGDGKVAAFGHALQGVGFEFQFVRKSGRTAEEVYTGSLRVPLNFLRLNKTGDRLAVFRDGIIIDPATGKELKRLFTKTPPSAWDAAWIGSSTRIVSLITARQGRGVPFSEEQIILSDAATGQQLQMMTHPTAMDCLAVSPDGKTIAEAGADKMVRLRDAETLAVKKEFRAHDDGITALAFHPTLPILATGSADLTVKLWNPESGKQIEELRGAVAGIMRLNFSPSGKRLAAKTFVGYALVWEPESLNGKPAEAR